MKTITGALACLAVAAGLPGAEDKPPSARALVNRAVKALGGAEKLARYQAATWQGKGTYRPGGVGESWTFRLQGARQGADQLALKVAATIGKVEYTRTLVVTGSRGWLKLNDRLAPLSKEHLAEEKERLYANWVATLAPLADKGFRLTLVKPGTAGEAPGVKVSRAGHRDVLLFFARKSGLLVKRETTIKDLSVPGRTIREEVFFSDHRPTSAGVKHAFKVKVHQDDRFVSETTLTEIKLHEKLPASTFAKP